MNYEELSKEISYCLRHAPQEYGLILDHEGWVKVEDLLKSLHRKSKWLNVDVDDLNKMIELSSKKRHEIKGNWIRAYYGHTIPKKISKEPTQPPEVLYHGTTRKALRNILKEGLKSRQRQYVHLSQDIETAIIVGNRRDDQPVILVINALQAFNNGVNFYLGNEDIWLSDEIPNKFIKVLNGEEKPENIKE